MDQVTKRAAEIVVGIRMTHPAADGGREFDLGRAAAVELVAAGLRGSREASVVEKFIGYKDEFDRLIERLTALSENYFGVEPEAATWSDVGNLAVWVSQLQRISDMAFKEGIYAA